MQHWITQTGFCFYVGRSSGLRRECAVFPDGIVAGFYNEDHAVKFAQSLSDGLNFVMIYGQDGKAVKTFSPF